MDSRQLKTADNRWQYAGENLRRLKTSGVYYAFVKRHGKQISRSLETTDKPLAKRRLADFLRDVERLAPDEAANLTFEQVAARWLETTRHTMKPSTLDRRQRCVKAVAPFLSGQPIKNVTASHCEAWLTQRVKKDGEKISAQTFAHELNTMRAVFAFALEHGMILRSPAAGIKKPRIVSKKSNVPTREQFQRAVTAIRAEPRERGGADLVELLAYSGMRLREATALRWRDVNFSQGVFTVTGGERGTKNHEQRTVPLSAEMLALLTRIKRERGKVAPDVESEFASILSVSSRDGNTLSEVIRNAWDSGDIQTLTKNNPTRATGAHISIIGHITETELNAKLGDNAIANGFGNRFLIVCAKRSKLLPHGGSLSDDDFEMLARKVAGAIDTARKISRVMQSKEARNFWGDVYPVLSSESRTGNFGSITSRAEAHVLRLSVFYALMDGQSEIQLCHLKAALECWRYCQDSALYIWGDFTTGGLAAKIRAALTEAGQSGLTRSQLHDALGGRMSPDEFSPELEKLISAGEVTETRKPTKGKPVTIYRLRC